MKSINPGNCGYKVRVKKLATSVIVKVILVLVIACCFKTIRPGLAAPTPGPERTQRTRWWREGRFGMFIHWGLYALPAGQWQGKRGGDYSEWLMYHLRIPVAEYEKLAVEFKPVKFNANEWVSLAKEAGMKYIVITAKHHDGFSMFDSKVTGYDIVDATPFKRDPMKELAAACRKQGIKLGFYYSVDRDWHHPDAQGNHLKQSNFWDYPDESKKDFDKYFDEFVIPQLTELLTNYGPVGIIWFDGIGKKRPEQNERLIKLVRRYQPDCLINSRLGDWMSYKWGDYRSMDDNEVSDTTLGYGWENPGTLNRTYGYSRYDDDWKSKTEIIRMLVDISSKGGNYLLNVGPKADGTIQPEAIELLQAVGEWMKTNSESIYETQSSPIGRPRWGRCTAGDGRLYLHVFDWPSNGRLEVKGLKNKINKAYLLADPKRGMLNTATSDTGVIIELPSAVPDKIDSVVVLEAAKRRPKQSGR